MSENPILILTVGLPRSGKSTWAKEADLPMVNPDSIRLALHGKAYVQEAEDLVWSIAVIMTRALIYSGHECIIIDATNATAKRRNFWREKFPHCVISIKKFEVGMDLCRERALEGGREDLVPVIERMAETIDFDTDSDKFK